MSGMPLNPALLLESLGGFSEPRYLSQFQGLDRGKLVAHLRGLNATEIACDGPESFAVDAILAPLGAGRFPRTDIEKVAENTFAVDDIAAKLPPLMLGYVASLSLYANMASECNCLAAADRAGKSLLMVSKVAGPFFGVELLKFYLWCFTLRSRRSAERSPLVCLTFSFFIIADLLAVMSWQVVSEAKVGGNLAEAAIDDEFVVVLRKEYEQAFGPHGSLQAAIQRARVAILGA
jgi:hypothetical protein